MTIKATKRSGYTKLWSIMKRKSVSQEKNIQIIRKHRGMKQQELANKIGINMQSLSKIERGVNYPTFDTLER